MEKELERNIGNHWYTYYRGDYDIKTILMQIKDSNFRFDNIMVDEGVEMDMQSVSGTYSIESVISDFDEIMQNAYDPTELRLSIIGDYNSSELCIIFYPKSGLISLGSQPNKIELDDIINKFN